jgi:hypothetical protein
MALGLRLQPDLDQAADGLGAVPRRDCVAGNGFLTWSNGTAFSGPRVIIGPQCVLNKTRMGIAYVNKQIRALTAGALLLLTLSLGGYATSTAGLSLMDARADEASAPRKTSGYPSLGVPPPPREIMTADEQLKLKKELTAARRASAAKAKGGAPQAVDRSNHALSSGGPAFH